MRSDLFVWLFRYSTLVIAIGRLCEKCDGKWLVRSHCFEFNDLHSDKVLFVTHMSDQKLSYESAMNVISGPMVVDA